jgi:uncharacterized membrane protein YeaQ/YmgE (transglycosylase-associated protein family)
MTLSGSLPVHEINVAATRIRYRSHVIAAGTGCPTESAGIGSERPRTTGRGPLEEIIGVLIAGIIGLLGKFGAAGNKDNIPISLTVLCGIGGVIVGWFIYSVFGGNGSPGIDWTRWIVAIVCAAVLVVVASTVTGRNSNRVGRR